MYFGANKQVRSEVIRGVAEHGSFSSCWPVDGHQESQDLYIHEFGKVSVLLFVLLLGLESRP